MFTFQELQNATASEGQVVVLECRVRGPPPIHVKWFRQGIEIQDSPDFRILQKSKAMSWFNFNQQLRTTQILIHSPTVCWESELKSKSERAHGLRYSLIGKAKVSEAKQNKESFHPFPWAGRCLAILRKERFHYL